MNISIPLILILTASIYAEEVITTPEPIVDVTLVNALPGRTYREPIQIVSMPDTHDELIIVERSGRVLMAPMKDGGKDEILLDLRGRLTTRNSEEGLLSLAFDPEWSTNKHLYTWRSMKKPRRGRLSRFTASEDGRSVDPETEIVILEVDQPWGNHNGGTVLFGPDGMLYLSIGDGGSANDPQNNGQDVSNLLGTIIRINPGTNQDGRSYEIPNDNPLVGQPDARGEIWAWGLRNVWRMSFDQVTGRLIAGDVGQNAWEEVDVIERGGNYGWRIREGTHPFDQSQSSEGKSLINPVVEYGRREGGSITGGETYRGDQQPTLNGIYFYADYMSGNLWGLRFNKDGTVQTRRMSPDNGGPISSFGTGPDGEIYAAVFTVPYQRTGRIMKILARPTSAP